MYTFLVKQIQITEDMRSTVNQYGWGVLETDPDMAPFKVKQRLMLHGADAWEDEYLDHFETVAIVKGESLDDVFRSTNLWDDGDNVEVVVDKMHSTSVGDIIVAGHTGKTYIVDRFGFKEIV